MQNAMFRLLPNGQVVYSVRITMQMSCLMDLARYPLDKQVCSLKMESYSHDQTELQIYVSSSFRVFLNVNRFSQQIMKNNKTDSSVHGVYDLSLQQFVVEDANIAMILHNELGFENQRLTLSINSVYYLYFRK